MLEFIVNKLQLRGKIGVYGRSLGGISACHLGATYPEIIKVLLVDRTFSDIERISSRMIMGTPSLHLFRCLTMQWRSQSDVNFNKAPCFKILTCDPEDDVIDNFASLVTGVTKLNSKVDYEGQEWKRFYENLKFFYEMDKKLNSEL